MATFKIDRMRQDGRTLLMSTRKTFSSSSSGVTGSVTLGARTSRDLRDLGNYTTAIKYSDTTAQLTLDGILNLMSSSRASSTNVSMLANQYLAVSRAASQPDQRSTIVFSPSVFSFDPASGDDVLESKYSVKKYARRMISGTIVPAYVTENQGKYFAVGNYFSHNFVTCSNVRSDTAIIFPDFETTYPSYRVVDGLTIDLHLNPRYSTERMGDHFLAGTIAHLPGCYALSLTTGSSKGPDGLPDKFRLILALTHSADVSPSSVDLSVSNGSRSSPQDLVFVSDDNILLRNTWNHISVSWSSKVDGGTGVFWVNGEKGGSFSPNKAVIAKVSPPGCLVVGNHVGGVTDGGRYFNSVAASSEGLINNSLYGSGDPTHNLTSPLNAELHSLKIYSRYISPTERTANSQADSSANDAGLIFYMPPVFMHESPTRQIPVTLFSKVTGTTVAPLNVDLMFGCGGRDVNLENFSRDITRFGDVRSYPRLYNLTSSLQTSYVDNERNFNNIFYANPTNRKRNLSVLPCDDGSFRLMYSCISSLTGVMSGSFRSYGGGFDYSQIDLTGIVSIVPATSPVPKGQSRGDPGGERQVKDTTSAYYQVSYEDQEVGFIFGSLIDISTIHYGHRIKPGSLYLSDPSISGSAGRMSMTFLDDKRNGLYRADCLTPVAHWNTQGVFYGNEGVGMLLAPTVPFPCKDAWRMEFDTDTSAHVLTMDVVVQEAAANVSQNPTYEMFPPTTGSDEVASNFVYIDTVNLHDENLNVVARATFAQPIMKRPEEEFLVRLKLDF